MRISDELTWVTPGWVFDGVLLDVVARVQPRNPRLAALLLKPVEGFQYLDTSTWAASDMVLLFESLEAIRSTRLRTGPSAFHEPRAFPLFMRELDELVAQLRKDARVRPLAPE